MVSALIEGAVLVLWCPVSEPVADTEGQEHDDDVHEFVHGDSWRIFSACLRIHFLSGLS